MTRNADIEDRWLRLWDEMFTALDRDPHLILVDERWQLISLEGCQGLVQDAVYRGQQPHFESTWFQGRPALQLFLTSTAK